MDLKKHRLSLAAVALVVATSAAVFASRSNTASTELRQPIVTLPALDKAKVDHLKLSAPEKPAMEFRKQGESWEMVQPVAAKADQSAIDSALGKLTELKVTGVVSTNTSLHERLEMTEGKAIHVQAGVGGKTELDLWIGPNKSTGTLVRVEGKPEVVSVTGSLRYPFEKDVHLYRDRTITDFEAKRARKLVMVKADLKLTFERESETAKWQAGEETPEIEKFDETRVTSLVSSFGRLRAAGFDDPGTALPARGPEEPATEVTLALAPKEEGGQPETVHLVLGALDAENSQYGLRLTGSDIPYRVSKYVGEQLSADTENFVKKPPPAPAPPGGGAPPGLGGLGGLGGGGNQIPPELLRQLQQQAAQAQH